MTIAYNGVTALAQSYVDDYLGTNFYSIATLPAVLAGISKMNGLNIQMKGKINRPSGQIALSGAKMDAVEKGELKNMLTYRFGVQRFATNNTVVAAAYDNMPTSGNDPTLVHSQVRSNAEIPWTGMIRTPCTLNNFDLEMAEEGDVGNTGIPVGRVVADGMDVCRQDHFNRMFPMFWTGNPSNWNVLPMDSFSGIIPVCGTANYARSTRPTGTSLVSHTITAANGSGSDNGTAIPNDIVSAINAVNFGGANIKITGEGVDLGLTDGSSYTTYQQQIMARGAVQVVSSMPALAAIGFTRECLKYNECYVTYDSYCPTKYIGFLTLKHWRFITHPKFNFTMSQMVNLKLQATNAPDQTQGFLETRAILACRDPSKQAIVIFS